MQTKCSLVTLLLCILSILLLPNIAFALTKVKFVELPINLVNQSTIQFIILGNNTGNSNATCKYAFGTEFGTFNITANKTKLIVFNITFPSGVNSITQSVYVSCDGNTLSNYSASKTFYAPPNITTTLKDKYSVFQTINFTVLSVTASYTFTLINMSLYLDHTKIPKFNSTLRTYTVHALSLTPEKHIFLLILNTSLYNATKYYTFYVYKPKYKLNFIFDGSVKPGYLGNNSKLVVNFTLDYSPVLLNISAYNITLKNDLTNNAKITIPFAYLKNYKKITIYANVSANKTIIYSNQTNVVLDEDLPELKYLSYSKFTKNNCTVIQINVSDNTSPQIFISANNSTGFIDSSKLSNFTIKNLKPGENNITIKIYDLGGNYITKNITVYYDNKNPNLFVNLSVGNRTNKSICLANISANDNYFVKFLKIILNGKVIFSKYVNTSKIYVKNQKINLSYGKNIIVFFVNDSSGRINETKYIVEMDNESPILKVIKPNLTAKYFGNMPVFVTAKDDNLDYIQIITSPGNSTKFYRNETKFEIKCGNITIVACDLFSNCVIKHIHPNCGNISTIARYPSIVDYVELIKGKVYIYGPRYKILNQKSENGSYVILNRTEIKIHVFKNTSAKIKFMVPIPLGYSFKELMINMIDKTKDVKLIGNYVSFIDSESSNDIGLNSTIYIYFSRISNIPGKQTQKEFLVSTYKVGEMIVYNFTSQNIRKKTISTPIKGLENITIILRWNVTKGGLVIKKIDNTTYLLIPKNCTLLLSLKNSTCGKDLSILTNCQNVETSQPLYVRISQPFNSFTPAPINKNNKTNENNVFYNNYTSTTNNTRLNNTKNSINTGVSNKSNKKKMILTLILVIVIALGVIVYLYFSGYLGFGEESERNLHFGFLSSHQNYVNNPQYEKMYEEIINEWIDYVSKLLLEGKQEYEIVGMLKEKGFTPEEIERIMKGAEMKAGFR